MNTGELLAEVRSQLNDVAGNNSTRFWSNADLIRYANAARDRLFLVVRKLVIDSTTASDAAGLPVCQIPLIAGTGQYAISKKILGIIRLKLATQSTLLPPSTADELDCSYGDWSTLPLGDPWTYCIDLESDSITFVPAPKAADTAVLTVYRFPLAKLAIDDQDADLGFREEYHEDLIPWMLHLAFRKQDSETYNPGLAEEYKKTFLDRAAEIKLEMHRHVTKPRQNRMQRAFGAR